MSMSEKREIEIDQANTRFYEAFESLDIRQMEAVWASDQTVHCIHPGWEIRSGWPSVFIITGPPCSLEDDLKKRGLAPLIFRKGNLVN